MPVVRSSLYPTASPKRLPSLSTRTKSTPQVSIPMEVGIFPSSRHFFIPSRILANRRSVSQHLCPFFSFIPFSKRKISSRTIFPFSIWLRMCLPLEAPKSTARVYWLMVIFSCKYNNGFYNKIIPLTIMRNQAFFDCTGFSAVIE